MPMDSLRTRLRPVLNPVLQKESLLLIGILGTLYLLHLYSFRSCPIFHIPIIDSAGYDEHARRLALRGMIDPSLFQQSIFFPLWLAAVYKFFSYSFLLVYMSHASLAIASGWLVYSVTHKHFGPTTGLLAGCFLGLNGLLLFYIAQLMPVVWTVFLASLLLWLFERDWKGWLLPFGVGLITAISVQATPTLIPWAIFLCVIKFYPTRKDPSSPTKWLQPGLLILGFALFSLPTLLISRQVTGKMELLPAFGSLNFYIGNHAEAERLCQTRPGPEWQALVNEPYQNGCDDIWEAQSYYRTKAMQNIAEQPMVFVSGMGKKLLQLLSSREIPNETDPYLFRDYSWILATFLWKSGGFGFPFGLMLPLTLIALIHRAREIPVSCWSMLVLVGLAIALVHVSGRYRLTALPAMAVCAGIGATTLAGFLRERKWKPLATSLATGAGYLLFAIHFPPQNQEKLDYHSEVFTALGEQFLKKGRTNEASNAFNAALKFEPKNAKALLGLGQVEIYSENIEKAESFFLNAYQAAPNYSLAAYNLGFLAETNGNLYRAENYYREAIRHSALNAAAANNLARILINRGKLDEAEALLRRAVTLKPLFASAWNNLGMVLAQQQDVDGARSAFETALKHDPENPIILENLHQLP